MSIQTIVIGATGYVGGELLRLIATHPEFELAAAVSGSSNGKPIAGVFPHLAPSHGNAVFSSLEDVGDVISEADRVAVFSAAPHGASAGVVQDVLRACEAGDAETHVVDSSADFRYPTAQEFSAVYGVDHPAADLLDEFTCAIPEHLTGVPGPHIGHPGCFATAMLLTAVPLYQHSLTDGPLFVAATTGSTGSGRSPQAGTHHPERHSNMYAYKPLSHRHVPEVRRLIEQATDASADIAFIPHSGPFARGIYSTSQSRLASGTSKDQVLEAFRASYAKQPFVHLVDGMPKLKNVVASNHAHIGIAVDGGHVSVCCAIDNLVKGAAGGAVQWMNRLWSLPDDTGLAATAPAWT